MIRRILTIAGAILFALTLVGPSFAQQIPPYVYPITLGTSSVSILPANTGRKKLLFHNPNDSAKVAVCPVGPNRLAGTAQTAIVAVINGAGCVTILPYDTLDLTNAAAAANPPLSTGSAWVGIASAGGSALTIWEWE